MNLADDNLTTLLKTLSPAKRRLLAESLREGATMTDDAKAILRWLKRRLKRKARAGKR